MFAIVFDLTVADTELHHPKSVSSAYAEIGKTLKLFGFENVQGSLYMSKEGDMVNLFEAIQALKNLEWFPPSVRDIRGFKVEDWSDFTRTVKG